MPAWPATLPQFVLEQGYAEQLEDQTIESQTDSGPAKVRRRFTVASRRLNVTVAMSQPQADIFEDFFLNTLSAGSLTFTWVHPRTQNAATLRFRKPPPSMIPTHSGNVVRVSMALEIMP